MRNERLQMQTNCDLARNRDLESKMKVRFDKSEMDEFYECFEPMDIQGFLDILFEPISYPEAA